MTKPTRFLALSHKALKVALALGVAILLTHSASASQTPQAQLCGVLEAGTFPGTNQETARLSVTPEESYLLLADEALAPYSDPTFSPGSAVCVSGQHVDVSSAGGRGLIVGSIGPSQPSSGPQPSAVSVGNH